LEKYGEKLFGDLSKMRILHIIDSLGLGGAQVVVKGIFESQSSNKDIFLFALRKKEITTKISHKNISISSSNKKYSFSALKELRSFIQKENIDVIHCHLFKSQLFGWILKKYYFPNIKLIQHEHGRIFQKNKFYNKFIKFSKKETNLFIVVSKATKKELMRIGEINGSQIGILHNFVDLKKFSKKMTKKEIQKEKSKMGIKNNELVIGFVGRLAKVKGCEYLIKSLPNLKFKYKCIIAGDGEEKDNLVKLSRKLNVKDKIIF
jgi:L-malate glycosyltransferase